MTIQEINKTYHRIIGSLDAKELKNAFDYLQGFIAGIRDYSFQDKLDELQNTYKYMLRYRIDGVKDPMETQIYDNLLTSVYELADLIRNRALTVSSSVSYYRYKRSLQRSGETSFTDMHRQLNADPAMLSLPERQTQENVLARLFNRIWTSDPLSASQTEELRRMLQDVEVPLHIKCQIVSALMLGLQTLFDKEKIYLLMEAAAIEEDELRIRAMIGMLLSLYTYRKRTALYPQIENRLSALAESCAQFNKLLHTITLRFILSRETEKISRKLQDEIIPEMMKMNPKISQKINLKDLTPEQLSDEMNPEWEEMVANSELGKMMQEFTDLQMEGADVMHSTFVHLKNYPFFREISNWFLPFIPTHSMLDEADKQTKEEKQIIDTMTVAALMCNSDKYSLYFSMLEIPGQARSMMLKQFDGEAHEMIQQNREELLHKRGRQELIAGQYIQDLYRFFKLLPDHLDFDDIFAYPLDFHNLPLLEPYFREDESLTNIAEYYLHKNYFNEALGIYNKLAQLNGDNGVLFQKIGYCKQMTGDVEGALEAYLHADLLGSESKWLIHRIAGCYRSLKQPEMALKYYHRYESLNPDNLSIQIAIGHCHLELKNYDEALKYYFKVDYLDSKSNKAWRPIAWCSFLTGKYDQARNYYKKIIGTNPNMQDYLNAGHTEWALQNMKEALNFYKKAVQAQNGDFAKFQEQFNQDIPDLTVAGIEEQEYPFMLDQLRYSLDNAL